MTDAIEKIKARGRIFFNEPLAFDCAVDWLDCNGYLKTDREETIMNAIEKVWQRFIDECESMMSHAKHREKVAMVDNHKSEMQHQDGRWHCANDLHEWAEKALREYQAVNQTGAVKCPHCNYHRADLEVRYTNIDGDWEPVCSSCQQEHEAQGQEVIDHEMKYFGGAYGLPSWETRPIRASLTAPNPQPEYHKKVLDLVEDMKFIRGIVEKGTGRKLSDDEKIAPAVLAYVQELERRNPQPVSAALEVLRACIGIPAQYGFCEPIEGYVERPQDLPKVLHEMGMATAQIDIPDGWVPVPSDCKKADLGTGAFDGYQGELEHAYNNVQRYINWAQGIYRRQALAQAGGQDGSKCNLCHKDMINLLDAYDMIKYLLPLAKGYVHANPGIKSTENIIEDAEAMLAAAPVSAKEG